MKKKSIIYILLILITGINFTSCKKANLPEEEETEIEGRILVDDAGSEIKALYNYAAATYLYNKSLKQKYPDADVFDITFRLRRLEKNLTPYGEMCLAMEMIQECTKGLDRFSYCLPASGETIDDLYLPYVKKLNFGLKIKKKGDEVWITSVNVNSTAADNHLERGMRILVFGNKSVSLLSEDTMNDQLDEQDIINLIVVDNNGRQKATQLKKKEYNYDPVEKTTLYSSLSTGYFALSTFTANKQENDSLNSFFLQAGIFGIKNLIIDLRYNTGGVGESAQAIANKIISSKSDNELLSKRNFNKQLQQSFDQVNYTLEDHEWKLAAGSSFDNITDKYISYFVKKEDKENDRKDFFNYYWEKYKATNYVDGSDYSSIENVCFIVSGETASASEYLINMLLPYVNVSIIGQPTSGKGVGFKPFFIAGYPVYLVHFQQTNGFGNIVPYDGYQPGKYKAEKGLDNLTITQSEELTLNDDITKPFGSTEDECVKMALKTLRQ